MKDYIMAVFGHLDHIDRKASVFEIGSKLGRCAKTR